MKIERYQEARGAVLGLLARLTGIAGTMGASSLVARLSSTVVEKLANNRFHLVVVGEFNHGKSSFVNALLGADLLPVGVTPTTACIHHVLAGPPGATLVWEDGRREETRLEDLDALAAGEGGDERARAVKYVEVRAPGTLLDDGIVLVDTPGVNDLSLQRADVTYSYIPQSDAVLFLLDAGQLVKESERAFLQDKLLAGERDKVIFVVTKVDLLQGAERDEALAYVAAQLQKLVPSPQVFPVSAHRARQGDPESGMRELTEFLARFLPEERGRLVLDHALTEGISAARTLASAVVAKQDALRLTDEELTRRVELLRREAETAHAGIAAKQRIIAEEISAVKAWAQRDLAHFVADVTRELPQVIDGARAGDLRPHLGVFLETTFRSWAEAETREIAAALEKLAERVVTLVTSDAEASAKRMAKDVAIEPPKIDVSTFAYDVGVLAVLTVGLGTMFANLLLGGLLTLAAPLLALWVRDKRDAETKERAKELAPRALEEAARAVGPKLGQLIDDFAAKLDAWVVMTGTSFCDELLEVVEHAKHARAAGAQARETEEAALAAEAATLALLLEALESERRGLSAEADAPGATAHGAA